MDPKTLARILDRLPALTRKERRYEAAETHRITVYVGQPGQAMIVNDVASCALEDDFVELVSRDTGSTVYVAYDAIHAITHRPPEPKQERRAGFF